VSEDIESCYQTCLVFYNLSKNKPGKNDIRKTILDIQDNANKLKGSLVDLDWFTLTALSDSGFFEHPGMAGVKDYIQELYADPELYPSSQNLPSPALFQLFEHIENTCNQTMQNGLRKFERSSAAVPHGPNYKQEIVAICLRYFEQYRPGEASTYSDGPFYDFVRAVWGMIDDSHSDASFDDAIKKALNRQSTRKINRI